MIKFLFDYGTTVALLLLCVIVSLLTISEQNPIGTDAATQVFDQVASSLHENGTVFVAGRQNDDDVAFVQRATDLFEAGGFQVVGTSTGGPVEIRREFARLDAANVNVDMFVGTQAVVQEKVVTGLSDTFAVCTDIQLVSPQVYRSPTFLMPSNLRNVANQISVTAILAAGMTFVIVTGGIDLSVGSLIALASVVATMLIRDRYGGENATTDQMIAASMAAIFLCACVGLFSGLCVEKIGVPPFIVTLSMMLVARGIARILAEGQAVGPVPSAYAWLGRGSTLFSTPNSVVLMGMVFVASHVLLSKTVLGRHIYAIGGNREAAYLSGVPVQRVVVFTYVASGFLAAVGGIVVASTYKSGSPNYGMMAELNVIAAVVVGGTSLSGGRGTIYGTLVGAFIIAVIRNGMNLTGVQSFTQDVILGLVILAAVTLDKLKERFMKHA